MNWRTISRSAWSRRGIFLCGNALVVILVYFSLVEPIRRILSDSAETLSDRQTTLARYEAVADQEGAVQDYAKLVAETNARGELIGGETNGVVNANLQARLKTLAQQAGVTIRSIQMLPIKTIRGAGLVGARIEIAGGFLAVHRFMLALEGEPPLLLVSNAILRGQSTSWAFSAQKEQEIEAQFDVYGGPASQDHS
jgi:general secretion pathway protein M